MRRIPANASLILAGDVGFRILGFVASVHLATALGGAAFGMVTVGLSFLAYAQSTADLGIGILGTRETARARELRDFQPGEILLAKILLATAVYPVAVALLYLLYDDPASRRLIHLFLLCLLPYALLIEWLHQGARNYLALAAGKLLTGTVLAAGIILFVDSDRQIEVVPLIYFAASLAAALLLLIAARGRERLFPSAIDWRRIATIIRRGATIGAASILGLSVLVLPPLVVERLGSAEQAGVLGAVLKIVTIFLAADRLFVALFLPAISGRWRAPDAGIDRRLGTTLKGVLILGCAVGITTSLFAGPILELVYGRSIFSEQGAPILAIVGWFVAATLLNSFVAYSLVGIGQESAYLRGNLRSGPIVVAAILAGTFFWGIAGTAVAIVLGEIIITLFLYPHFKRHLHVAIARPLFVTSVLSAVTVATGYLPGAQSLWQIPLYLLCFIGVAMIALGIGREEISWLRKQ